MCIEKIKKMIVAGDNNEKIAAAINMTASGVKWHIGRLRRQYKAKNRIDLAVKIAMSQILHEFM